MEQDEKSKKAERLDPRLEFDKILSKLTAITPESVKQVERIVQTPSTQSKYDYDIQVNSQTGKQTVVEKFSTTMEQCSVCKEYTPQTWICEEENCGTRICANHRRQSTLRLFVCPSCYQIDLEAHNRAFGVRGETFG